MKGRREEMFDYPKVSGILEDFSRMSDFGACLVPLLHALGYRGDLRHVAEALPHFATSLDLTAFRNVMGNLTFKSDALRINLAEIDPRLTPCLFAPDKRGAMVLYETQENMMLIFDGETGQVGRLPPMRLAGTAYFFKPIDLEQISLTQNRVGWFRMIGGRFRRLIYYVIALTFFITLLQVITPLYVMSVYDRVVGSGSMQTLAFLVGGASLALAFDWFLRKLRAKMLMFVGARMDSIVGNAIFLRILAMQPSFTERAPIGSQVARIKDFDTVREFFTGPLALVFFELPFTIVFLLVIAALGGPIAFLPAVTALLFVLLWVIMTPLVENEGASSRRARARKQEFTVEALNKIRALKYMAAEQVWFDRYRDLSAKAAMTNFRTSLINAVVNTISHVLMIASGLGIIGVGVLRVLSGDMTVGGLVASMVLVWRVLSPLQSMFLAMTRLEQVKSSIKQIDGLMNVTPEFDAHGAIESVKQFKGAISFVRVSLRYSADAEPALMGVQFDIQPGQVVVIVGSNGSGKSTIIKLIAGMYTPQAGSIRIDDLDIRQINPIELRHAISYVPQSCDLFYGTIAQNLRLAHATATREELVKACRTAEVLEEIMALPDNFDTRIGDARSGQLASSTVQKLSLARAYLQPSTIYLFDEPASSLDWEADQAFQRAVERLRGENTIIIVTHRPSHMKMADQLFFLDQGYLRLAGSPDEVLDKIPKDLT